jgi:uncharacterized protein (UPF0262 family)
MFAHIYRKSLLIKDKNIATDASFKEKNHQKNKIIHQNTLSVTIKSYFLIIDHYIKKVKECKEEIFLKKQL